MSLKIRSFLVLMVGTVLGITVSAGSAVLAERGRDADLAPVVVASATPATVDPSALSPEYIQLLSRVVQRVRAEYVDPVEERRIVENAIRGILTELDPHSRYLPPNDYEEMRISTTGNYTGVGLDIRPPRNGRVVVAEPLPETPAERAGILPGDVILAIDGVEVTDENYDNAISRMRGEPGTVVTLDIERAGLDERLSFELVRDEIHATVRTALLENGYGYARVMSFANTTTKDLEDGILALQQRAGGQLSGLVLDLRNNPGGVLDAAVDIADLFLSDGLIVRGLGRARQAQFERYASPGDPFEQLQVVVLVNSKSASASEIVAGALKDHGRAQLVGARTYGKGSVQTVMPIGSGSAIKLTTSLYVTPSGFALNGIGIDPDVFIGGVRTDDIYRGFGGVGQAMDDEQLNTALSLIGYAAAPAVTPATTTVASAALDAG